MARLPALFISHGSPMLAIQKSPAHAFLSGFGRVLPRPTAIVVISAHWESAGGPAVSLAAHPQTMHDFGGFPQALFAMQYPAPGAPEIAMQIKVLLAQAGFAVQTSADRGLDHGAWVPLSLIYPDADIPVTQVSVVSDASPDEHVRIGLALSSLRDQGVLLIGSGALTHNLYELRGHALDAAAPRWVSEFGDWMKARLEANECEALMRYQTDAPSAARNHPTQEHIAPLFVALGAGGKTPRIKRLHGSYEYGVLAMDMYAFD